jgi:predicted  nucleic acid-binding Zn-ribbon protein
MSRSYSLFTLQQFDTGLDVAHKRIREIDLKLQDRSALEQALKDHDMFESIHNKNAQALKSAEHEVALQNGKIEQNQKKLYSGTITNPKELEDLQLESNSLNKYLQVLEERQLEAMLASDRSQSDLEEASNKLTEVNHNLEEEHKSLLNEKNSLEEEINSLTEKKTRYLESEDLPDLQMYQTLREKSGGIAVTLMIDSSCNSCGASIPSAIEQSAKSPSKLAFCPTCKRILHPG